MFLAAEFGTGQVLLSLMWFFLFFLWIMLIFYVFGDIIRSHDISGWSKALWTIAIILIPYLGIFMYLIVRGGGMAGRSLDAMNAQNEAAKTYVQQVAGGSSDADQLANLADLHSSGKLTDDEYAKAKAKIIG